MPHQTKTPPIKCALTVEQFNKLVGILYVNEMVEVSTNSFSNNAKKLKEKLLKYSIPFTDGNDNGVQVGFFVNEVQELVLQLLVRVTPFNNDIDFYSILLESRKTKIKNVTEN